MKNAMCALLVNGQMQVQVKHRLLLVCLVAICVEIINFFPTVMDLHRANVYLAQLGLCNF